MPRQNPPPARRRAALRDAVRQSLALRDAPWEADLALTRGKCRKCRGRWAVTRLTLNLTCTERVERIATLECAHCGHTWRRIRPTLPPASHGLQRARITLVEPGEGRTVVRTVRGRRIATGEDVVTTPDVTLADTDEAVRAWRKRSGDRLTKRALAQARKAHDDAIAVERFRATLARIDARREAESAAAAAEAEAAAREAAYA